MGLCPDIEGEGKQWKFLGVWMKNRAEWTLSLLACMYQSITTVGFFDAMSVEQVDFILNQTEMTTLVVTPDYAKKIITMKSQGLAQHVQNLIVVCDTLPHLFENVKEELEKSAQEHNLNVYDFAQV